MEAKYRIKLKAAEKKKLKILLNKGVERARKLTRCRILLMCDSGQNKEIISKSLSVDLKTNRAHVSLVEFKSRWPLPPVIGSPYLRVLSTSPTSDKSSDHSCLLRLV